MLDVNHTNTDTIKMLLSLKEYYKETGTTIIGMNESLGVPCAIRNKNRQGFSEIIAAKFRELGINVTYINAFSMCINKSWHINRILEHNLNVAEIKKTQELSIAYARKGLIEKIGISKGLQNMYSINNDDYKTFITSELQKAECPIFFYSCGANNIMHKLCADPIGAIIDPETRERALRRLEQGNAILSIIHDIQRNFEIIYALNNRTDIYCLGIYNPLFIERLMKHFPQLTKFKDLINDYNNELIKLCQEYNASYIDNNYLTNYCAMMGLDFHVVQKGHNIMAEKVIEQIYNRKILSEHKQYDYSIYDTLNIDNKGLLGMIENANDDYLRALRNLETYGLIREYFIEWSSKAHEYRNEYDLFADAQIDISKQKVKKDK